MSIKVIDLNYTYGAGTAFEQHALKHVNFEINDGEFVGLIGHTGSGKSNPASERPDPAYGRRYPVSRDQHIQRRL